MQALCAPDPVVAGREEAQLNVSCGVLQLSDYDLNMRTMRTGIIKMSCALALVVCWESGLHRAVAESANPYEAITGRNVFGLKAPPPPPDPTATQKVEPPKMKLQGISTILGRKQVLVKVLAKPPLRPKDESLVIDEGNRNGELEVIAIDEKAGTVKFNNNGEIVTLDLNVPEDVDRPVPGPAPALPPALGLPPPIPVPPPGGASAANQPVSGSVTTFGGASSVSRPLRGNTSGAFNGAPSVGGVVAGGTGQPAQNTQALPLPSREEQQIMIEVNRMRYKDAGDPRAKLLPPTKLPTE